MKTLHEEGRNMKTFEEFLGAKTGLGSEEIVNEEVTAGNGTEVLTESTLGTSVGQELKKYLKVAVKIPEPSANGVHKLPLKPDGIHGALCKSYELSIRTSQVSDDENGSYWAYRFDLSWAYKNGGTNGNSICTIWVTDEGKILGSRAASL